VGYLISGLPEVHC